MTHDLLNKRPVDENEKSPEHVLDSIQSIEPSTLIYFIFLCGFALAESKVMKFLNRQNRYAQLVRSSPAVAEKLQGELQVPVVVIAAFNEFREFRACQVYLKERHSQLREKAEAELSKEAASLKARGLALSKVLIALFLRPE